MCIYIIYIPGPSSLGAKYFNDRVSSQHPLDSRRVIPWHRLEGSSRYILLMFQKSTSSGRLVVDSMIYDGFINVLNIPGGFLPGFLNHQAYVPTILPLIFVSQGTSKQHWPHQHKPTWVVAHGCKPTPPGNGRPYFRGYEAHHCHLIILFFMANQDGDGKSTILMVPGQMRISHS